MNGAFSAASQARAYLPACWWMAPASTLSLTEKHVMTRMNMLSIAALTLATLGASFTAASAETPWQYNHPRRAEVNARLGYQNYRIDRGEAFGRISPYRAAQMHAEDRTIRNEERTMARFNGGYITPAEQRALNQQENAVSRQIGP
jgi:hypothetical protein